jgi:L,D-transpeptidase YcbB
MRTLRALLALIGPALAFCAGDGASRERLDDTAEHRANVAASHLRDALEAALEDDPPEYPGARENWKALRAFYGARSFQPIWVGPRGTRPAVRDLLTAICDAEAEGLRPSDYRADQLQRALSDIDAAPEDPSTLANAEMLFSLAYVRYGLHLATGRIPPQKTGWLTARREVDAAKVLSLVSGGNVKKSLAALEPKHEQYARLKRSLQKLRAVQANGGWPEVPRGGTIEPGARSERVRAVRERLRATGELRSGGSADPNLYDPPLVEAVKRFQQHHGLKPDGRIGGATLAALRASPADRVAQIVTNLERWRWLPDDLGERHVLVNVPAFDLQIFDHGKRVTRMRVVAGHPDWPTPVFTARMTGVDFHPQWSAPKKIVAEEILPNLQADPTYAQQVGLRVISKEDGTEIDPASVDWKAIDPRREFPFRFIQLSGADNPLRHVRFAMPNRYAIFLHDTPEGWLFEETQRAFSHGCVRVDAPEKLTEFVLRGTEGWSAEAVRDGFRSRARRSVEAVDPPLVHLVYFTAWVEDDGTLRLLNDVYGRDAVTKRHLAKSQESARAPQCS